jgi:hypothetical protein
MLGSQPAKKLIFPLRGWPFLALMGDLFSFLPGPTHAKKCFYRKNNFSFRGKNDNTSMEKFFGQKERKKWD